MGCDDVAAVVAKDRGEKKSFKYLQIKVGEKCSLKKLKSKSKKSKRENPKCQYLVLTGYVFTYEQSNYLY